MVRLECQLPKVEKVEYGFRLKSDSLPCVETSTLADSVRVDTAQLVNDTFTGETAISCRTTAGTAGGNDDGDGGSTEPRRSLANAKTNINCNSEGMMRILYLQHLDL